MLVIMNSRPILLIACCSVVFAADEERSYTTEEWFSPQQRIVFTVTWDDSNEENILYASYEASPKKRQEIHRFTRSGTVLVSADQEYFALNHHWGSDGSDILIFQRSKGLDYRLVDGHEIYATANTLVENHFESKTNPIHHFYIDSIQWANHNNYLLCQANGHGDGIGLNHFIFIYNVQSKTASMDLELYNQNAIDGKNRVSPDAAGFSAGECTWYAFLRAQESGWRIRFDKPYGRHARAWWEKVTNADRGSKPKKDSIMVLDAWKGNQYGHVSYVEEVVSDDEWIVTHANWRIGKVVRMIGMKEIFRAKCNRVDGGMHIEGVDAIFRLRGFLHPSPPS